MTTSIQTLLSPSTTITAGVVLLTVIGIAYGGETHVEALQLAGDRASIRAHTITAAVAALVRRAAE